MKKRVLISKADVPSEFILFCDEHFIELHSISFIAFIPVNFDSPLPKDFEVIFFTSPRAVHYFWKRYKYSTKADIACIGETTAAALRKIGKKVDFIGIKSGDPLSVALDFKQFAQDRKILFPQSTISNRSIQKEMEHFQIIDLVVYETRLVQKRIESQFDIYVFTSPSNVQGYFLDNKEIPSGSIVISWGKSTTNELLRQGVNPTSTLEKSTFEELKKVLYSI